MNQMKDVSDEELRKIEQGASQREEQSPDLTDEQLINMVKATEGGSVTLDDVVKAKQEAAPPPAPAQPAPQPQAQQPYPNANFWEVTNLPSLNKFYPEGTRIFGRPMKVIEVKKISSMGDSNGDFILNDIVRRTTKGIDHDEMYVADKLFIIFWLRANTYRDSGYVVNFVCPKCEMKSEYHFEIDNLEVQHVTEDFNPASELKMKGGDVITYDYLKIKDELYIDRFKELNYKAVGEVDDELLAMAQMVKTINGKELTLLQKYHWVTELDPGDFAYMRSYMEKKGMGIKPYVNVTCKECGGTVPVAVSFRSDFFIPEYKFE